MLGYDILNIAVIIFIFIYQDSLMGTGADLNIINQSSAVLKSRYSDSPKCLGADPIIVRQS